MSISYFGVYMLIDDAEIWWGTLLKVKFGGVELMWGEFREELGRPLYFS